MSPKLFVLPLLAAVLFSAPAPTKKSAPAPPRKSALDKPTLEAYVRHLFVWGPEVKIEISDPKPSSSMPGYLDVTVHASAGASSQNFPFYVSKDGQKIVQGTVFDIAQNPFKRELDKLKTQLDPSFGTPGATVVLVEFSDYQCPYCKQEAKVLRTNLLSTYPKQVRLYFKDLPLEQLHPWAKPAAMAGRCVFKQNATLFWDYHDWIYEHQGEITPETLKAKVMEWAKGKEIDALQLERCMDTRATEADVDRNIAEAKELNVASTPTLFVNGRRLVGPDWAMLRSVIDYEINYQKTAKNAGEDCGCDLKLTLPGM